ncbi:unnamed protein product [Camellia sinensis]
MSSEFLSSSGPSSRRVGLTAGCFFFVFFCGLISLSCAGRLPVSRQKLEVQKHLNHLNRMTSSVSSLLYLHCVQVPVQTHNHHAAPPPSSKLIILHTHKLSHLFFYYYYSYYYYIVFSKERITPHQLFSPPGQTFLIFFLHLFIHVLLPQTFRYIIYIYILDI